MHKQSISQTIIHFAQEKEKSIILLLCSSCNVLFHSPHFHEIGLWYCDSSSPVREIAVHAQLSYPEDMLLCLHFFARTHPSSITDLCAQL